MIERQFYGRGGVRGGDPVFGNRTVVALVAKLGFASLLGITMLFSVASLMAQLVPENGLVLPPALGESRQPQTSTAPESTTSQSLSTLKTGDSTATAATIVVGFDSLQCAELVNNYYAGGFGSLGSGPGPNYGITFSSNAQVQTDSKIPLPGCASQIGGGQNTTDMPSSPNGMLFQSGLAATMNVPAGFAGGFSFYYAAPYFAGSVTVWSGLNGTGTQLASLNLPITGGCSNTPHYCVWYPIGVSFSGTAQSVNFGGSTNFIVFDSITLGVSLVVNPAKSSGNPSSKPGSCSCGDPVSVGSGNLFEQVSDYQTSGSNAFGFTRYYNSLSTATFATALGVNWRGSYDRYIRINSATSVTVERDDGQQANFNLTGNTWTPDTDVDLELTTSGSGWILTDNNDTVETYTTISTTEGLLSSITARNGYQQSLHYNGSNQLISVADSYSRTLSFAYLNGLLLTMTTPDGLILTYGYTSSGVNNRLTSVTYSTNPQTSQSYLYENSSFPFSLTGILDEKGNRYATWTYDQSGRALTSQHAGGADLTTFVYNDTDGSRTVTNALGQTTIYKFSTLQGVPKLTEIDRQATATTAAASRTFTYDANGYVASQTDWNGNLMAFINDAHGQPTTITEAVGSPQARTTTITYLGNYHLPSQTVTLGLTTNFIYDSSGNLLTKTQIDTTATSVPYSTNGQHRTWTYTWSNFLLASAKGPRTDVSELTSFAYDSSGALTSTTNALGQVTKITQHLPGGLPQVVVDPNNVTTQLAYDARLRLLTSTVMTSFGPLTTKYVYDAAGNLASVTLADGSTLTNSYDAAHRLTGIADLFNQRIAYTLDALGDRTQTKVFSTSGIAQRQHSAAFDALGRVRQDIGGASQTTAYSYDSDGNALLLANPLGRVTQRTFDALSHLVRIADPAAGITTTSYDSHDRPTSVTDPNGNTTTYTYDGFGDVTQQVSPVTGSTSYRFDPAGNLVQSVDSRGAVANITYDALDRVLTVAYPSDAAENVSFTYDESGFGFGIGRLTTVSDAVGTVHRTYDERGNILNENRQFSANGPSAAMRRRSAIPANSAPSANSTTAAPVAVQSPINASRPAGLQEGPQAQHPKFKSSPQAAIPFSGQEVTKINPGTTSCTNPPPATSFSTSDAAVYLYFEATTTVSDLITSDWLAPDGAVLTGDDWTPVAGLHCYPGASLTINPNTQASRLGAWQARVYDNGTMLFSVPFTLTAASSGPPNSAPGISYSYDSASRVSSITYPSGWSLTYVRDTMGRVTALTAKAPGATASIPIASNIGYQPFGSVNALTYGNGISEARTFDLDYRLTNLADAGNGLLQKLTYGYDAANNVLSITDGVTSGNSQSFGYDVLNRLTSAAGGYGALGYTYDPNGNRLSQSLGGTATAAVLDGMGSVSGLTYDQAGRLATVTSGSQQLAQYTYDAFGHRSVKVGSVTAMTLFQYDTGGRLLEESNGQGAAQADYVYLDGRPIAEISAGTGNIYFLHDDRLGTPQLATDTSQAPTWVGNYQPFGALTASSQTALLGQDLRLPGQENDQESGLYHNGFRNYVPAWGRYSQSDPIGLNGGLNTYAYVSDQPLDLIDPDGTQGVLGAFYGVVSGGIAGAITGYSSGGVWGAVGGAVIGGAIGGTVGFVLAPESTIAATIATNFLVGLGESYGGDVVGNYVYGCQGLAACLTNNVNLGAILASATANALLPDVGPELSVAGVVQSAAEGALSGISELFGGSLYTNHNPFASGIVCH